MATNTLPITRGTTPLRFILTWPAEATGDDNLTDCTVEVFEPDACLTPDGVLALDITDETARQITGTLTLTDDQWLTFPRDCYFTARVIYPSTDKQACERIHLQTSATAASGVVGDVPGLTVTVMSGGARGDPGPVPDISIGTTTTVDPDQPATVTIDGTSLAPVLHFEIPKGDKGDDGGPGPQGDKGDRGDATNPRGAWSNLTAYVALDSVTYTDGYGYYIPADYVGSVTGTAPGNSPWVISPEAKAAQDAIAAAAEAVDTVSDVIDSVSDFTAISFSPTNGYINKTNGAVVSDSSRQYTTITGITSTSRIRVRARVTGSAACLAAYYNSSGTFISYQAAGPSTGYTDYPTGPSDDLYELTIPSNTASIKITNTFVGNPNPFSIERYNIVGVTTILDDHEARLADAEATLLTVDPAIEAVSDFVTLDLTPTTGYYIQKSSGTASANANYEYVTVTGITSESRIRVRARGVGSATCLAAYYNSGGTFLGYEGAGPGSGYIDYPTNTSDDPYELTIPDNTASIKITNNVLNPNTFVVQSYQIVAVTGVLDDHETRITAVEAVAPAATAALDAVSAFSPLTFTTTSGYVNKTNGTVVTNASREYAVITGITSTSRIRVRARVTGSATCLAAYYNSGGSYIGYEEAGPSSGFTDYPSDPSDDPFELTIPASTASIKITNLVTGNSNPFVIESYGVQDLGPEIADLASRVTVLEAQPASSRYTGLTAVWFGTSIPTGGGPGIGSYVERVAAALGMTIYKETISGSAARAGTAAHATMEDPYGWTGRTYRMVAYALSGNLTEKQYLIDNWDTVKSMLSGAPDTLDSDEQAVILASSYENKLTKYLTGGSVGPVDFYIFDHGHNDVDDNAGSDDAKIVDMTTIPDDPYDRGYFVGAINFLTRLILEDNYQNQIINIGHYENARKPWIYQGQIVAADQFDFPLLRVWERIGWSQQVITVDGVDKTMTQAWLPDDLHPGSDTTGKANDRYAQVLTALFKGV